MFVWMRSHQRKLMLAVAILTIIAFVFLYNTAELDQLSAPGFAKIYGKDVTIEQIQREARSYNLALALGLVDFVSTLDGNAPESDPGAFVFNTMVLRHEAERLGINPPPEQIAAAIAALAPFQTNGGFDRTKYAQFVQNFLAPQGFTELKLEEVVRDSLLLARVTELLESAPTAPDSEVDYTARLLQNVNGVALRLETARFLPTTEPSAEDIQTFYDANTFRLITPETRSIRTVRFELPEADRALTGKERIDALQKIADQSATFADQAATSSLVQAAEAAGLTVETSLPFERNGRIVTPEGVTTPNEALAGPILKLAPTAFTLSTNNPVSGVVQDGDAFYVAELDKVTESREMTLDEARATVIDELRTLDARAALEDKATSGLAAIRDAVKGGTPIAEAAASAGFEAVPFKDTSATSGQPGADQNAAYADATVVLKEGEISGFQFEPWGGFAVYLEERLPIDPERLTTERPQIVEFVRARKQSILLFEWLESAVMASGLSFGNQES